MAAGTRSPSSFQHLGELPSLRPRKARLCSSPAGRALKSRGRRALSPALAFSWGATPLPCFCEAVPLLVMAPIFQGATTANLGKRRNPKRAVGNSSRQGGGQVSVGFVEIAAHFLCHHLEALLCSSPGSSLPFHLTLTKPLLPISSQGRPRAAKCCEAEKVRILERKESGEQVIVVYKGDI